MKKNFFYYIKINKKKNPLKKNKIRTMLKVLNRPQNNSNIRFKYKIFHLKKMKTKK